MTYTPHPKDLLCRFGQRVPGARHEGGCDEPRSTGAMCAEHHARLMRAVAPAKKPGERPINAGAEPAPVITRHVAPRVQPPPRPAARAPREQRALRLARRVHEVGGRISAADAADAAGVKPSALRSIARHAVEQGWIRGLRGPGGGYGPGDVAPPTENTNLKDAA